MPVSCQSASTSHVASFVALFIFCLCVTTIFSFCWTLQYFFLCAVKRSFCLCFRHFFVPANLLISVNWFLCHLKIHQILLFLVMDYRKQNSGRIWSKRPPHCLTVSDWEREMELNSRKSDLDQPGMWMDLVILFFFLLLRWKLQGPLPTCQFFPFYFSGYG